MARSKGKDELTRTVRKDWYYFKGDKLGKKERRWRLVFEYLDANGQKQAIKDNTFKTKTAADFKLRELILEHTKKGVAFGHRKLSFGDYAETYKAKLLKELETGKTESNKVDIMTAFFGSKTPIQKIRRLQVKAFKEHLQTLPDARYKDKEKTLTPRTVNTYLERLRAMLNEACADELIDTVPNIAGLIDRKLERKRTDMTITTAQLFELLAKCDEPIKGGRFKDRKHLKLPLIASHELGCRVGELRGVKRADILYIDHEDKCGVIRMRNNKASKLKGQDIFKDVPFGELLYDEMMANGVLDLAPDARAIMRYKEYKNAWTWLRNAAGLDKIQWRDLRAVSATNRKFGGQDLETIQSQIGHEKGSPVTKDHYFRELVDTIKEHTDYMKWKRQQTVIQTETVN